MTNTNTPSPTPNVVVSNPSARKMMNVIVSTASIILGAVLVADGASEAFDVYEFTYPASAVVLFLASAFNLGVTLPNTPKR